jgi:hypothetical protein
VVDAGRVDPALWLAVLSLCVAVVGLVDDIRSLSAAVRLVFQLLVAAVFVHARRGLDDLELPGVGRLDLGALAIPATVLFIVWLTNAYNFMDGIDGIAGLQAVAAGVGWVGAGHYLGDSLLAGAGAVVAGASLGFLLFNWSPASIFMGDVGRRFSDSLRRPDRLRLHSVSVGRLCRPPLSCGPSSLTRSSRCSGARREGRTSCGRIEVICISGWCSPEPRTRAHRCCTGLLRRPASLRDGR